MEHYLSPDSDLAFDMLADALLFCICGESGDSEQMLDHLASVETESA